jgi:MoaA/NifB/PqqE/SkfB family radical SAM enzyme
MSIDNIKKQNLVSLCRSQAQQDRIERYANEKLVQLQHIFFESVDDPKQTEQVFTRTIIALIEYVIEHDQCAGVLLENMNSLEFSIKHTAWFMSKMSAANKTISTIQSPLETHKYGNDLFREIEAEYQRSKQRYLDQIPFQYSDFPKVISVVVHSSTCFSKCLFCPLTRHPERIVEEHMDLSLFESIIEQIPENQAITVRVGISEETLSYDDIHDKIRYIKSKRPDAITEYATIGIPMNKKNALKIIESGLDRLMVSLNAPNKEDYQWFTGIDGFDRVVDNMKTLMALKREMGSSTPYVTTKIMTITRWEDQIKPMLEQLNGIVDEAIPSFIHYIDDDKRLTNIEEYKSYQKPIVSTCTYLTHILTIMPDGRFQICCAPDFTNEKTPKFGNAKTDKIRDVWQGHTYQQLRLANSQGKAVISSCQTCNVDRVDFTSDILIKAKQRHIQAIAEMANP